MKNILFIIILIVLVFMRDIIACENSADFQMEFMGSVISSGHTNNSALIKLKENKAVWFVEGNIIQQGYILHKIKKDYILVQDRGRYFKIYLDSCEPRRETDNPGLYLASSVVSEVYELYDEPENTDLSAQQQRIFLEVPATNGINADNNTDEKEQSEELKKGQMRIFTKIAEQITDKEIIDPDIQLN